MDYIRNSQNRKLKTRFFRALERMNFSTARLSMPGRMIILLMVISLFSLSLPWLQFHLSDHTIQEHSAFSRYVWGVGYGIVVSILINLFFLLSFKKKEVIRWFVPFRLSDAQAIVFTTGMLLVAMIELLIISRVYFEIALWGVVIGNGFLLAFSAAWLMVIAAYFVSRAEKASNVSLSYLEKRTDECSEYANILDTWKQQKKTDTDENMSLPI